MPTMISERGIKLIQKWEGLYLKAYRDSVGIWTIGWGSITNPALGINVFPGLVITREEAEAFMKRELEEKCANVARLVKVPLSQNQFDALVSFAYNVGWGALQKSTLLKLLNRGDYTAVPNQLRRYSYAGGKQLRGLLNRRLDEIRMWNGEHIEDVPDVPIIRVPAEQITPITHPDPVGAVLKSGTAKAAAGQASVAAGAAVATVGLSPIVILGLLAAVAGAAYVIWRKYEDIKELR